MGKSSTRSKMSKKKNKQIKGKQINKAMLKEIMKITMTLAAILVSLMKMFSRKSRQSRNANFFPAVERTGKRSKKKCTKKSFRRKQNKKAIVTVYI